MHQVVQPGRQRRAEQRGAAQLRLCGPLLQQAVDLGDGLLKAEVQQPVSLVQDQPLQRREVEAGGVLQVVQQPPGGGHQEGDAATQARLLLLPVLTPDHGAGH